MICGVFGSGTVSDDDAEGGSFGERQHGGQSPAVAVLHMDVQVTLRREQHSSDMHMSLSHNYTVTNKNRHASVTHFLYTLSAVCVAWLGQQTPFSTLVEGDYGPDVSVCKSGTT